MKIQLSNEWRYLVIICIASVIVMLPIVIFGIPAGNDLEQHFQFAQTYYNSILSGDGFPNWSSSENFGYGSIGIRFYPPLAYYVLAFARMIAGSWFDSAWLAFMFWMALGCIGVYYWSRCWLSPKESAIAGIFYAFSLYHLNQLYISFVYADFAGASVLPFCFAFMTRVVKRERKSDILYLGVSYAGLVLTHLPTTVIGSLALAVYFFVVVNKSSFLRQIIKTSLGIAFGLAASSFYWVRMVSEMSWLNHSSDEYSSGHYYFANQFFPLSLHASSVAYKPNLVQADILMALCLLFLASAVVYLFYRRTNPSETNPEAHVFRFVLPIGIFAFAMATDLSYPIWKILTPLQKVQFPLRWMSVVSMCGAVVTAASVHFLLKGGFLKRRAWIYISIIFVALFSIVNITYTLHPSSFVPIPRQDFEAQMRDLPEQKNRTFWWSIWSKPDALKITEKVVTGNRQSTVTNWKPEERDFTIKAGEQGFARVATFWYPRWRAEVNGTLVEVSHDDNGAILIPIPAQEATVRLWFQEPAAITLAAVLSMLTWLLLILSLAFSFTIRLRHRKRSASAQEVFAT